MPDGESFVNCSSADFGMTATMRAEAIASSVLLDSSRPRTARAPTGDKTYRRGLGNC